MNFKEENDSQVNEKQEDDDEKRGHSMVIQEMDENNKSQILNKFESILSEFDENDSDITILFRLDWTSMCLKSSSIDPILSNFSIPEKILKLLQVPSTPIAELTLRITNFLCRNSNNLLRFMCENIGFYYKLIRAPRLFPLVAELIDGMITKFPFIAADVLQKEVNIVHVLTKLIEIMPPTGRLIVCYIIYRILGHLNCELYEDFKSIVTEPLAVVTFFLSSEDIIDDSDFAPIIDMLSEILKLFNGDLHEILADKIYDKIVYLTKSWAEIDSKGILFGSLIKLWNIILTKFPDQFLSMPVYEDLIDVLTRTFWHPYCPRSRCLFLVSNLCAIQKISFAIADSELLEEIFLHADEFSNEETEISAFLFMNSILTARERVFSKFFFTDTINNCFDICGNTRDESYDHLFMKTIDFLLCFDDSMTTLIDSDLAHDVFTAELESNNPETVAIATKILQTYFPEE